MHTGRCVHRRPKLNSTDVSRQYALLLFLYQKQGRYSKNHDTDRAAQKYSQDYDRYRQAALNRPIRLPLCRAAKYTDDYYHNPARPSRQYEYKAYKDRDFLFSPFPPRAFQRLRKGICLYRLYHRILMQAEFVKKSYDAEQDSRSAFQCSYFS